MHSQSYANSLGYLILTIGLAMSLVSAFVPHFEAGYRLLTGVLLAGISPYIIYGIAVPLSRTLLTTILGLAIIIAHALLVFNERFIDQADYSDGTIYYYPLIIAFISLPLVAIIINKSLKS